MKNTNSKPEDRMTNDPPSEGGLGHKSVTSSTVEERAAERSRRRIERWKTKYNPDRIAAILADKAESMRERYKAQTVILCQVEKCVGEVTDVAGVPRIMKVWYMDFGRQVYRVWRNVPSSVRDVECGFVRLKWQARGLDPAILDKVKCAVVKLVESLEEPGSGR
ncbi:hypothetical protein FJY68_07730 [candidate division WOR-3 bacterium]|uniref:Uncharacterized protein n=1 Tax=candidate division WOR-3 bacterium TaxID=2052148 RepID=A0A938BTK9_UNCW3|nr:hypothetical protein [candidate division WOR-3 bacterium]